MKKTNLLPSKQAKIYKSCSSEREIYETESCFQLKVEDGANVIQKIAQESGKQESEVIDILFYQLKNYHIYNIIEESIDSDKYDVDVNVSNYPGTRTADVKISKRSVRKKIREGIKAFFKEQVG